MSLLDSPDLKKGFWLGLGLLAAFLLLDLLQSAWARARAGSKRDG